VYWFVCAESFFSSSKTLLAAVLWLISRNKERRGKKERAKRGGPNSVAFLSEEIKIYNKRKMYCWKQRKQKSKRARTPDVLFVVRLCGCGERESFFFFFGGVVPHFTAQHRKGKKKIRITHSSPTNLPKSFPIINLSSAKREIYNYLMDNDLLETRSNKDVFLSVSSMCGGVSVRKEEQ